MKMNVKKRIIT